jgi:hypothetical protein
MIQYRYLTAAILLALSLTFVAGARAQSAGEANSVYPSVGAPGARFTFIVAGFKSRERVAVWYNTPTGKTSDKDIENLDKATREGRVSWAWSAPKDSPTGTYQMVARGISSGIEKVVTFQIQETKPQAAANNIEPKRAAPGTLLIFYASGYLLDEDVRIWANAPDGTIIPVTLDQKRIVNGRVDGSWQLPKNALFGRWQLVIHGVDSRSEQVLAFEVVKTTP